MSLEQTPFDELGEGDLQALVTQRRVEQKTLEYKLTLKIGTDGDKKEFLGDVSSFANSAGGYLVYGVKEVGGVPTDIPGLELLNQDETVRTIDNIIRDGLQPRLTPIPTTRAIQLKSGRFAVVIHVSRSWNAPHMVTFKYKESPRFLSRTSNGKYPLDVGEIRSAFLRSETLTERIRAFRAERLAKIVAGETPRLLPEGAKVVLHLVPFGAFDPGANFPITAPDQRNNFFASLHPIGTSATSWRMNFDGVLRYSDRGYVQLFRNGCVEAVDTDLLKPHEGKRIIPSVAYEHYVVVALRAYLPFLKQLSVEPPIAAALSLLEVAGYTMAVNRERYFQLDEYPIDRNDLLVPEEVIDSYDCAAEDILKPSFDTVWNATGWERSLNYDETGHWKSPY